MQQSLAGHCCWILSFAATACILKQNSSVGSALSVVHFRRYVVDPVYFQISRIENVFDIP